MNVRSFPAGSYIFHEGTPGDCAYVLESGKVAITTEQAGKKAVLTELGPGSLFGEMALIDLFPRSASVMALEDSQALELTQDALYTLYEKDLEQFAIIHMNLGRELSRRLRDADEKVFRAGRSVAMAYEEFSFLTL